MSLESTLTELIPHLSKLAAAFEKVQPLLELIHKAQSQVPALSATAPPSSSPTASQAPASPPAADEAALRSEAKALTTDLASILRDRAVAILAEFGAKKAPEVALAKVPEFIAKLRAAITELKSAQALA